VLLALTAWLTPNLAVAQDWPTRPVRIVNTFAPGGAADILARIVADHMSSVFNQQFYVETRAGAGGAIGVTSVANSPPDGYNFVITNVSLLTLAPTSNPKLGYDPLRDLVNIGYIAGSPMVFCVHPASGVKTLAEFVAYAKKSDKPLTYSSSGVGSNGHLVAESFAQKANIKIEHVPYKGAAQGLLDLVGGHIVFSSQTLTSSASQIRGGAIIPIAHTNAERIADYPDVPTFKELGYPDIVSTTWFSLSGPAKLPSDIVDRINSAIVSGFQSAEMRKRLAQEVVEIRLFAPEEFKTFVESEIARWGPIIKTMAPVK
jgi:tripartite-type tricarboxylate transporter receptor subunit TctC